VNWLLDRIIGWRAELFIKVLPAGLVAVEDCFGVFDHFFRVGMRDDDNAVTDFENF